MSYRDDLDALAARHATLEAEIGQKQRELAEVAAMLAEAGRVEQAERYFERAPELRRARRPLIAGALALALGFVAAFGYATTVQAGAAPTAWAPLSEPARTSSPRDVRAEAQRLKAEVEALCVLGLIPVVAPQEVELAKRPRRPPTWLLGSRLPARGSLWTASAAREDQR